MWAGPASTVQRKSFAFSGGPPRATEGHGVTLRGWALAGPSRRAPGCLGGGKAAATCRREANGAGVETMMAIRGRS